MGFQEIRGGQPLELGLNDLPVMVIVTGTGFLPKVYGPFISESERWDFIDNARRFGYECLTTDLSVPFRHPTVLNPE